MVDRTGTSRGGGVAEVSCAFLLGVIALPYAWQTMRCARRRARVAETWGKRDCAQAVRVSPFRSNAYRGMGGVGTLCRDLCAGQPGAPSPRPLQFDSGVSVATGSWGLFSAVLGPVCMGSCTSACTSATPPVACLCPSRRSARSGSGGSGSGVRTWDQRRWNPGCFH